MILKSKDFKLGAGLSAFCLFLLLFLIPNQVGPLTEADAMMPVLITCFILLLAVLLMAQAWRGRAREKPAEEEVPAEHRSSPLTLAVVVGIMAAYAWLLEVSGFVLTSLVAMVILFLIFGVRNWLTIGAITVATLGGLYLCFETLLGAPLPVGTFIENLME